MYEEGAPLIDAAGPRHPAAVGGPRGYGDAGDEAGAKSDTALPSGSSTTA